MVQWKNREATFVLEDCNAKVVDDRDRVVAGKYGLKEER